ncbi:MAG: sensor histidine kinase [Sphingomonas bacterium]|nr:sensor histidine kinase [Sphingomonas bacterium]
MSSLDNPIHGRVTEDGRLIAADPQLAELHVRAGGEMGGPLAVPQLAALARLARRLGIPIARAVMAADGEEDLDLWVRARPDDGAIALAIASWTRRPISATLASDPAMPAEQDFVRAEADWFWACDAALRLVSLSGEGMATLTQAGAVGPVLGDSLTRIFVLDEAPEGGLPLLDALAGQHGFDDQFVTLRGTSARFRLAAAALLDPVGRIMGFRGGGFSLVKPVAEIASPAAEAPIAPMQDGGAFARRLDTALRTPLHRIVAAAEAIKEQDEGPLRADYGGYAGDIANAGRHLLGLVDDLVDLEAVERDEISVAPEPIDMADLARRAAGLLSVRADDKEMRIDRPEEGEKLGATGDFRRGLQVLVNLIGNAVRFGPAGSAVGISVERRGAFAAAIVVDAGRGVPEKDRERVFDKFERLGAREPGSGLGLYISRRLARAMGGDVAIEGPPSEGARFVFTLPAQ